jgi:hypothetical protein
MRPALSFFGEASFFAPLPREPDQVERISCRMKTM